MKIIVLFLFTISFLQVILGVSRVLLQRELIDFSVYYQAAKASLSMVNPYTQVYGDYIAYNYPPSALVFFWPFTILSHFPATLLFTLLSLIVLLIIGFLLTQKLPSKYRTILRFIIFSLLLQNFPTKFTLVMGQVNMFVLLFLVLSFVADQKKRSVLSGIFYGLASMIKLTPLTLAIYFLIRRRFASLMIGLGIFAVVNFIMLTLWQGTEVFFSAILPQLIAQPGTQASLYDQSIRAFLARISLGSISSLVFSGLITLFLFGLAIIRYISTKSSNKDLVFFSLILAITIIGSSYTWQHHLVFLFPGFIAEALYLLNKKSIIRGILLLTSAILVGYHFPDIAHPPTTNPILISHSLFGALVLIFLLLKH